jgi:hypothetical protein
VGAIQIFKGDRPRRKASTRGKFAVVAKAAVSLQPGEHFEWKDAPKGFPGHVKRWAKKSGVSDLTAYTDNDGRFIIARPSDDEFMEEEGPQS